MTCVYCCICVGGRDAAPIRVDIVQALGEPLVPDTLALGRGPRAALQVWQGERRSIAETRLWLEEARRRFLAVAEGVFHLSGWYVNVLVALLPHAWFYGDGAGLGSSAIWRS